MFKVGDSCGLSLVFKRELCRKHINGEDYLGWMKDHLNKYGKDTGIITDVGSLYATIMWSDNYHWSLYKYQITKV